MPDPILAWIFPVSAGQPAHPIAPGGQPPGIWGGANQPFPGYGLPGDQPGIWPSPGYPAHPIAPGGPPPSVGGGPIYPGAPAHPIAPGGQPPHVEPPIYHPGHPDHGLPVQPGHPAHPIYHPGHPDHGLPVPPPQVGGGPIIPPPPTDVTEGDFAILIFVPGKGLHWVVVDKDLVPTHPIVIPPEDPPHVAHPIQPTPAPKK